MQEQERVGHELEPGLSAEAVVPHWWPPGSQRWGAAQKIVFTGVDFVAVPPRTSTLAVRFLRRHPGLRAPRTCPTELAEFETGYCDAQRHRRREVRPRPRPQEKERDRRRTSRTWRRRRSALEERCVEFMGDTFETALRHGVLQRLLTEKRLHAAQPLRAGASPTTRRRTQDAGRCASPQLLARMDRRASGRRCAGGTRSSSG